MKSQKKIIIALALIFLASCSHRSLDFSVISTKRIDLSGGEKFVKSNRKINASDKAVIISIFPTGYPSFQNAVDNALAQVPGAIAIVDGTIYERFWWIPLIYGVQEIKVSGVPIMYKTAGTSNNKPYDPKPIARDQNLQQKSSYQTPSPSRQPIKANLYKNSPEYAGSSSAIRSEEVESASRSINQASRVARQDSQKNNLRSEEDGIRPETDNSYGRNSRSSMNYQNSRNLPDETSSPDRYQQWAAPTRDANPIRQESRNSQYEQEAVKSDEYISDAVPRQRNVRQRSGSDKDGYYSPEFNF